MSDPLRSRTGIGPHPRHATTSGPDWFARSNVLVVCGTGACLSPVTAATLRAGAQGNHLSPHLVFSAAGLHGAPGSAWCEEAQALSPVAFAPSVRASRPRRVTADLVAQADLVLVMHRRQKAEVRTLDPRSASRTFTLREAAVLGRSMVDRRLRKGQSQLPAGDLVWFVSELDALRGVVATADPARGWWSRFRRSSDPLDLHDPHTDGGTHRHVILQINVAARELTAVLAAATSPGRIPPPLKEPGRHRRR